MVVFSGPRVPLRMMRVGSTSGGGSADAATCFGRSTAIRTNDVGVGPRACAGLPGACDVVGEGFTGGGEACNVVREAFAVGREACNVAREALFVSGEACIERREDSIVAGQARPVTRGRMDLADKGGFQRAGAVLTNEREEIAACWGAWSMDVHMNLVPRNTGEKIQFFQTHVATWTEHAEAIGTSLAQVAALADKAAVAQAAFIAQQAAYSAAESATATLNNAVADMASAGAGIILQVRAKAGASGDGVYVLAKSPAPAKRSPRGAPGSPSAMAAELQGNGALLLTWRCKNPRGSKGTVYHLSRRDGAGGEFKFLAIVGTKRFVDESVPAGAAHLVYQIQAVRSTSVGDAAQFPVNFGGVPKLPKIQLAA